MDEAPFALDEIGLLGAWSHSRRRTMFLRCRQSARLFAHIGRKA